MNSKKSTIIILLFALIGCVCCKEGNETESTGGKIEPDNILGIIKDPIQREQLHGTFESEEYQFDILLGGNSIEIMVKRFIGLMFWDGAASLQILKAEDKNWEYISNEKVLFEYLVDIIKQNEFKLEEKEGKLMIKFSISFGKKKMDYVLSIPQARLDIEHVLSMHSETIKNLDIKIKELEKQNKMLNESHSKNARVILLNKKIEWERNLLIPSSVLIEVQNLTYGGTFSEDYSQIDIRIHIPSIAKINRGRSRILLKWDTEFVCDGSFTTQFQESTHGYQTNSQSYLSFPLTLEATIENVRQGKHSVSVWASDELGSLYIPYLSYNNDLNSIQPKFFATLSVYGYK